MPHPGLLLPAFICVLAGFWLAMLTYLRDGRLNSKPAAFWLGLGVLIACAAAV